MTRLHLHVRVPELPASIAFYRALFGAEPSVRKNDYAKWMLDDPAVNFAISTRGSGVGLDHVGIQVDSVEGLAELAGRLRAAGEEVVDQTAASCCYARSDKAWIRDPAGLAWETFHTFGEATTYGEDAGRRAGEPDGACCAPGGAAPRSAEAAACC